MDSSCGRGGGNGSSWSKGCIFTKKGGSYLVQPRKGQSSSRFMLDDEMEDLVKVFTKKHG